MNPLAIPHRVEPVGTGEPWIEFHAPRHSDFLSIPSTSVVIRSDRYRNGRGVIDSMNPLAIPPRAEPVATGVPWIEFHALHHPSV